MIYIQDLTHIMASTRKKNIKSTGNKNDGSEGQIDDTAGKREHYEQSNSDRGSDDTADQSLKQLLLSIRAEMTDMRKELSSKLTVNQTEIRKVRDELRSLKETVHEVEKATASHAERLDDLEHNKLPTIQTEMEKKWEQKFKQMEKNMLLTEIHDRKLNLLFYGVPERDEEDASETMIELFQTEYGLSSADARCVNIVNTHRLPTRNTNMVNSRPTTAPSPLICRFVQMKDREYFGDTRKLRRGSKVRVLQDLPADMKRNRGRLAGIAYRLRTQEGKSTRIRVRGTCVILESKPKEARGGGEWERHYE